MTVRQAKCAIILATLFHSALNQLFLVPDSGAITWVQFEFHTAQIDIQYMQVFVTYRDSFLPGILLRWAAQSILGHFILLRLDPASPSELMPLDVTCTDWGSLTFLLSSCQPYLEHLILGLQCWVSFLLQP